MNLKRLNLTKLITGSEAKEGSKQEKNKKNSTWISSSLLSAVTLWCWRHPQSYGWSSRWRSWRTRITARGRTATAVAMASPLITTRGSCRFSSSSSSSSSRRGRPWRRRWIRCSSDSRRSAKLSASRRTCWWASEPVSRCHLWPPSVWFASALSRCHGSVCVCVHVFVLLVCVWHLWLLSAAITWDPKKHIFL